MPIKILFPPAYDETIMSMLPLGMATLTSFLRKKGIRVEQDDLLAKVRKDRKLSIRLENFRDYPKIMHHLTIQPNQKILSILEKILDFTDIHGYDYIGLSVMSKGQFSIALCLAKHIKDITGAKIVFGGSLITSFGNQYFGKFDFVDYMVCGGGEQALELLCSPLKIKECEISGLMYRKKGVVYRNPESKWKIEEESIPDFDGLPLVLYRRKNRNMALIIPYRLGDGCKNRCNFCSHHIFHRPDSKTADKVVREMQHLSENYGSKLFYFCDSTLNMDIDRLAEVCDALKGKGYTWIGGYVRPAGLNPGLLKKMRDSGCLALFFGVESGSDRILTKMNKGFTIREVEEVIMASHKLGILNSAFMVVDYPQETRSDFESTLNFIARNKRYLFDVIPQLFHLEHNSIMLRQPGKSGLINARLNTEAIFSDIEGNNFIYDEASGKSWNEIRKRQKRKLESLNRVIYRNIRIKQDPLVMLVPYTIYRLRYDKRSLVSKLIDYYSKFRSYDDPWLFHLRHSHAV